MWSMLKQSLILVFILSSLFGCGEANEVTPEVGLIPDHQIVNDSGLTATQEKITGTGSVLFESELLEGVDGAYSFYMEATLEDGGSASLISFANADLSSGVTVTLSRSGTALSLSVDIAGTSRTYTDLPEGLEADEANIFLFTVIQGEPTRVLAWLPGPGVEYKSSDAIFDTQLDEDNPGWTNQKGQGAEWGVSLNQASLTYVRSFANERLK